MTLIYKYIKMQMHKFDPVHVNKNQTFPFLSDELSVMTVITMICLSQHSYCHN